MNRKLRGIIRTAVALIVLAAVVVFFRAQLVRNWNQIRAFSFHVDYGLLFLAFVCICVAYLLNTAAWRYGINLFARRKSFSFTQSIGMVNTTQLTKYIPGKVWSYALQAALTDRKDFPVSIVLSVNLFLVISSVFICLFLGGLYFVFSSLLLTKLVSILVTAAVLLAYVFFLAFNGSFFALFTKLCEKLLKRSLSPLRMSAGQSIRVQLLSLVSSAALGLSALFCAMGIGFPVNAGLAFALVAGFLLSDTIGFLAFFVPGGIGIRESLFYMLLREQGGESISLIVPIVMRLLSMLVDAALGALGVVFLRRYMRGDER